MTGSQRYKKAHPDRVNATNRLWRAANSKKFGIIVLRWKLAHPENVRQHAVDRRARVRGAEGSHTPADWLALLEVHGRACHYCQCTDKPLTRDHVIPLSRGGSHSISNIVPACHSCNSKKGTRTLDHKKNQKGN